MDKKTDIDFIEWTIRALKEKDIDRFMGLLMKREEFSRKLREEGHVISFNEVKDALKREEEVLARLENEKTRVIHEIEKLSLCMKAVRAYKAQFPIPQKKIT
jgi:hypothetical protein